MFTYGFLALSLPAVQVSTASWMMMGLAEIAVEWSELTTVQWSKCTHDVLPSSLRLQKGKWLIWGWRMRHRHPEKASRRRCLERSKHKQLVTGWNWQEWSRRQAPWQWSCLGLGEKDQCVNTLDAAL